MCNSGVNPNVRSTVRVTWKVPSLFTDASFWSSNPVPAKRLNLPHCDVSRYPNRLTFVQNLHPRLRATGTLATAEELSFDDNSLLISSSEGGNTRQHTEYKNVVHHFRVFEKSLSSLADALTIGYRRTRFMLPGLQNRSKYNAGKILEVIKVMRRVCNITKGISPRRDAKQESSSLLLSTIGAEAEWPSLPCTTTP